MLRGPIGLISSFLGLDVRRLARVMAEDIGAPSARVGALGLPLGRALSQIGLPVVTIAHTRRRSRGTLDRLTARPDALPLRTGSLAAFCLGRLPPGGIDALRECCRAVAEGGLVLVGDLTGALDARMSRDELAALFVHANLVDIRQRATSGGELTTGRVLGLGR